MSNGKQLVASRLASLERHLRDENPVLLEAVKSYRQLDDVAWRMGLLADNQSFALRIPWWPLVSVLGTFSSGKSSFINNYLDLSLQLTGNQAVDDRFTVICHSRQEGVHTLPGLALDADPRFPFYQISEDIEQVAKGEGKRIDAYLQLKTCPSEQLRGKIVIDSPGFDADSQRTSTLRITEHIINLSDLVLVFFDARHPEPGAMQDTLEHLVSRSIGRADSSKFLYILNQIDTAAREDNPEEVFGAWQRALAQAGLTAGRFYTIYNSKAAVPIDNESLRLRFEARRDADLREIYSRMHQVEVERAYRIVGNLEKVARDIELRIIPIVTEALKRWRNWTLIGDGVIFGGLLVLLVTMLGSAGMLEGLGSRVWAAINAQPLYAGVGGLILLLIVAWIHGQIRRFARLPVERWLVRQGHDNQDNQGLIGAFRRSTGFWRGLFCKVPAGWSKRNRSRLVEVVTDTDRYVQKLNDNFANPSGKAGDAAATAAKVTPSA
jgi:hypothetical protein